MSQPKLDYRLRELAPMTFIYEISNALPEPACRDIIARFERNVAQQYAGRIGHGQSTEQSIKRSTDLHISGRADWKDVDHGLFLSLDTALREISKLHRFFAANEFKDMGYNIQRTRAGEFYKWHVDSGPGEFSRRQLVAIWYLNDVAGPGGETEFYFQKLSVRPQTGKLLLFPPFWTHIHQGATPQGAEEKYIATTWVCFPE